MDITRYVTYDLPVPYRSTKIYPITVKDYLLFNSYSQCLTIDKNSTPDIKIITMTELEYIFYSAKDDKAPPYLFQFDRVLSLCLKDEAGFESIEKSIERYNYSDSGKPFFIIGKEKYLSDDFDEIKKIICEQNMVDIPDSKISKEVRDSLEEARLYRQKIAGTRPGSLEDYIISLSTAAGWTIEYVNSMPVRKFIKSIRRLDNLIHYKIYLAASMSGMVQFKDKSFIKHWLTNIDDEDKYSDVTMELDEIKDKISMESAKK